MQEAEPLGRKLGVQGGDTGDITPGTAEAGYETRPMSTGSVPMLKTIGEVSVRGKYP
jgi:hypothetical protein